MKIIGLIWLSVILLVARGKVKLMRDAPSAR